MKPELRQKAFDEQIEAGKGPAAALEATKKLEADIDAYLAVPKPAPAPEAK